MLGPVASGNEPDDERDHVQRLDAEYEDTRATRERPKRPPPQARGCAACGYCAHPRAVEDAIAIWIPWRLRAITLRDRRAYALSGRFTPLSDLAASRVSMGLVKLNRWRAENVIDVGEHLCTPA